MNAYIRAIGMYVPDQRIENDYFEKTLDTTSEWIVSRTGIRTRYHARPDEFTSELCVKAVQDMTSRFPVDISDVDQIIVGTITPDQPMPGMACVVQYRMGLHQAGAFDLYAACAGFSYALIVAKGLIAAGTHRKVLVIGGETLSKITDFSDRTSCVLFGDGAGAALVEAGEGPGNIGACVTGAFGEGGPDLYLSGLAEQLYGQPINTNRKIVQNGRKVFKWAVQTASAQFFALLAKNNLTMDQLDWFIPHSANFRILEAVCLETGFPMEKTLESVADYGNTSTATIPIALSEAVRSGRVKDGDKILIFGFGGGLTYAGTVITWGG
jgi:3-oxoacyl-[acyl-carrier-protein] synthase-3